MTTIIRSWTVAEAGHHLTISESPKPDTISITLGAQTIELSQEQWHALTAIGSKYDHDFTWATTPYQEALPLEEPATMEEL